MSFKHGDLVKRKDGMWKGIQPTALEPFDSFTVSAYFADQQYPTVIFQESGSYQWDAAYFELVEQEKVKTKRFAVGDHVISVKNTPNIPEGFIGFINHIDDFEYPYQVISEGGKSELFREDELELLSVGSLKFPRGATSEDVEIVMQALNKKTKEEPLADYLVEMFSKPDPTLEEAVDNLNNMLKEEHTAPIKSDGGSSSYYDLPVPEWLLSELFDREIATEGKPYIKTEEIIAAFFGNDFDYANIIKCLVRVKGLQDKTGGKAGNSVDYECNKMKYSVEKIRGKR